MMTFVKKFWKWILAGLAALSFTLTVWRVRKLKTKIKLLELDKFMLETEAKNSIKKTEIMADKVLVEAIRAEAQRLFSVASEKGIEVQKLQQELKNKLGDKFKNWDELENAARGSNASKP